MTSQLEALRRYVADQPATATAGGPDRVLLVGSGKGGVGTSTVAALLGVMAAAEGEEVLLVDADESHGALPLLCGVHPRHSLSRLRGGELAAADLLVSLGHGLSLLPVGGGDPADRLEPAERRAMLRRCAALYPRFDLVIVDAGSRLEQVLAAASVGGSRLLALSAAERVAAAATYALVKVIDAHYPAMPVDLLFNRCTPITGQAAFDEVDSGTRHFLRRGLEYAGAIPDDERLRAALDAGTPIQDAAGLGSAATGAAHELAARLIRQMVESDAARSGRAHDFSHAVAEPRLIPRR